MGIFFESIFKPLVISAAVSYIAINGNYFSVVFISFIYSMASYLVPIIPNILPIVWSLIINGLVFITVIIYYIEINEKGQALRIREKRVDKYIKKPIFGYLFIGAIMSLIVAFFIGMFPIYPVVVLTDSMEPTLGRGNLVLVERVPNGDAFIRVGEGEVLHYKNHLGVEYIHRVVDFTYDINGERQYITRGDASYLTDPYPVIQSDVLGIARAALPFIGYPYIFFRSITGGNN